MRHVATEARVRRAIGACREQGIEATPEVVAQIMAGEDGLAASHEAGRANAHADYLRAATWVLLLLDEGDEQFGDSNEWPDAA